MASEKSPVPVGLEVIFAPSEEAMSPLPSEIELTGPPLAVTLTVSAVSAPIARGFVPSGDESATTSAVFGVGGRDPPGVRWSTVSAPKWISLSHPRCEAAYPVPTISTVTAIWLLCAATGQASVNALLSAVAQGYSVVHQMRASGVSTTTPALGSVFQVTWSTVKHFPDSVWWPDRVSQGP